MLGIYFCCLPFLLVGVLSTTTEGTDTTKVDPMPDPDGNLHIYHLPVGVGDSIIIQCPDGVLGVVDTGTVYEEPRRHWTEPQIRDFIGTNFPNIQNIIITHNHFNHQNMMPSTFSDPEVLTGLQNLYISCTVDDLEADISDWITSIGAEDKVRTFNGGAECGPIGGPCGNVALCPNNPEIIHDILGANLGQRCMDFNVSQTRNMDSIISKITYNQVSILLPGDIDDETDDPDEDGPLKWLVDFYGSELQVTYGHAAHHGDSFACNKPNWLATLAPRFMTSSGDPWNSNPYPNCQSFDRHLNLQTLCKPAITDPVDLDYCGDHILDNPDVSEILQTTYSCCYNSSACEIRTANEYAIYTTTQDFNTMNLIDVGTDGTRFGIRYEAVTL